MISQNVTNQPVYNALFQRLKYLKWLSVIPSLLNPTRAPPARTDLDFSNENSFQH